MIRKRTGLTLLELLVVIVIIGILLALAMPSIQRARESMRFSVCQNNMRQLGLAIQNYHASFKQVPNLYNGGFRAVPPLAVEKFHCHSWRSAILPQLERSDLFRALDWNSAASSPENQDTIVIDVSSFVCPSTSTPSEYPSIPLYSDRNGIFSQPFGTAARTDYEAVAGMYAAPGSGRSNFYRDADFGGWAEPTYRTSRPPKYTKRRFADITDGLSNTLQVGERAGLPDQHYADGRLKLHQATGSRQLGMWAVSTYLEHLVLRAEVGVNHSNVNGLYSFHSGGANILLADGSVRLLGASTDLSILRALITRAGND